MVAEEKMLGKIMQAAPIIQVEHQGNIMSYRAQFAQERRRLRDAEALSEQYQSSLDEARAVDNSAMTHTYTSPKISHAHSYLRGLLKPSSP